MFRRNFLVNGIVTAFASLFGVSRVQASTSSIDLYLQVDYPSPGKKGARFYRKTEGSDVWPEVQPKDIKSGDVIIAIGISEDGLWMAQATIPHEFYLDHDGIWASIPAQIGKGDFARLNLIRDALHMGSEYARSPARLLAGEAKAG